MLHNVAKAVAMIDKILETFILSLFCLLWFGLELGGTIVLVCFVGCK